MVGEELGTEFGLKAFNETAEHFIVLNLGNEHGCLAEGINVGGGRGSLSKGSLAVAGLKKTNCIARNWHSNRTAFAMASSPSSGRGWKRQYRHLYGGFR